MLSSHIDAKEENRTIADVTGVILAGGRSTRMGRDKATLEVEGMPLFHRVLAAFQEIFPSVLIAGDRADLAGPDLPYYPDRYPGSALGGLYTGLCEARTEYIFVAGCDMPFPDPQLIRTILAHRRGFDVVVPRTPTGLEPLFAVYGKGCLGPMRQLLDKGCYAIIDLFPLLRVRYVTAPELPPGWERALRNINTPEEYRHIEEDS
jgi:molybdopterin-guanine dinucleotide biosynthesis protein A